MLNILSPARRKAGLILAASFIVIQSQYKNTFNGQSAQQTGYYSISSIENCNNQRCRRHIKALRDQTTQQY